MISQIFTYEFYISQRHLLLRALFSIQSSFSVQRETLEVVFLANKPQYENGNGVTIVDHHRLMRFLKVPPNGKGRGQNFKSPIHLIDSNLLADIFSGRPLFLFRQTQNYWAFYQNYWAFKFLTSRLSVRCDFSFLYLR